MLIGGIGIVVIALIIAGVLVLAGGDEPNDGDTLNVRMLAVDDDGPDPFTSSVATADLASTRQFAATRRAASTNVDDAPTGAATIKAHAGDEAGLHGTTGAPACDQAALAEALTADPAKANAWARAAGVPGDQLETHLTGLTPAVLGTDTIVTNHGWASGKVTSFPSVLEGGTPVLLDSTGAPVVRCACGNPLTQAQVADNAPIHLDGNTWAGFDPGALAIVQPAATPQASLQLTDIASGQVTAIPVGSGGALDGVLLGGRDGVAVVSGTGARTIMSTPVQSAFPDGTGGFVYTPLWPSWQPSTAAEATVWRAPAGAGDPIPLLTTDDPTRLWFEVQDVVTIGDRHLLLYERFTIDPADQVSVNGDLHGLDLESGADTLVSQSTSGYEHGMWSTTSSGERLAWLGGGEGYYWLETVDGGLAAEVPLGWEPFGPDRASYTEAPCDRTTPETCPDLIAFVDDTTMISAIRGVDPDQPLALSIVDLGAGGATKPLTTLDDPPEGRQRLDVFDGKVLVSATPYSDDDYPRPAQLVDIATGTVTRLPDIGFASFTRGPIRRPVPPVPTPATGENEKLYAGFERLLHEAGHDASLRIPGPSIGADIQTALVTDADGEVVGIATFGYMATNPDSTDIADMYQLQWFEPDVATGCLRATEWHAWAYVTDLGC